MSRTVPSSAASRFLDVLRTHVRMLAEILHFIDQLVPAIHCARQKGRHVTPRLRDSQIRLQFVTLGFQRSKFVSE